MGYTGQCSCGAVTGRISGEPVLVRQCWCRQCQQIACGSATTNTIFQTGDVELKGALTDTVYVAASGNRLTRSHCAACGTQVAAHSSARPQFRVLRLGFIDSPHDLRPSQVVWTAEAPAWAVIDPALERHQGQPPAPVSQN